MYNILPSPERIFDTRVSLRYSAIVLSRMGGRSKMRYSLWEFCPPFTSSSSSTRTSWDVSALFDKICCVPLLQLVLSIVSLCLSWDVNSMVYLFIAFACFLRLFVHCACFFIAFVCLLHLFVCCICLFIAFACLFHFFVYCICLFIAFVCLFLVWVVWVAYYSKLVRVAVRVA